jgi:hypothetical protein
VVEGIEGGDAAGAGRLAGEGWWWAGGCGAGVLGAGVGVGRRPARWWSSRFLAAETT